MQVDEQCITSPRVEPEQQAGSSRPAPLLNRHDRRMHEPLPIRFGRFKGSSCTPLGHYATYRSQLVERYATPSLNPRIRRGCLQEVPICSLDAVESTQMEVFNSTTKMKCVPIPQLFNQYCCTPRSTKKVSVHSSRYTPHPPEKLTSSLFDRVDLPSPKRNLLESQIATRRAHAFRMAREVIPHRLNKAFYMKSQPAPLFSRTELLPSTIEILQDTGVQNLAQKPDLFYGTGVKPDSGCAPRKTIQKFEDRLREVAATMLPRESMRYHEAGPSHDAMIDRYAQLGRIMTPHLPVPDYTTRQVSSTSKDRNMEDLEENFKKKIFLTEQSSNTIRKNYY